MGLEQRIREVLSTPIGDQSSDPHYGFEGLETDGSTKLGISEQVFAAMAREALVRNVPGAVFNDITAHRDGAGQLMKIEVEYLDQVHDPAPRVAVVDYRA